MKGKLIAYLVLTHGNPLPLRKFIFNLSSTNSHFFIHVDLKTNITLYKDLFDLDNVTFVKKRFSVVWKGFSQVKAEAELLKTAISSRLDFKYYSLHSGVDINVVSVTAVETYLRKSKSNFIHFKHIKPSKSFLKYFQNKELWMKISKWHFYDDLRVTWRPSANKLRLLLYRMFVLFNILIINSFLPRRKIPRGVKFYFGDAWWTINNDTAKYIVEKWSEEYLHDVFKYTDCPDEMYFQTVILNSQFSKQTVNVNLRYIDWSDGREKPSVLDERDYANILKSKALFGRKIDMVKSKKLIMRLGVW